MPPSIYLVAGAGFVKEGFSRQYLRVGGKEWKDHEPWAILNHEWIEFLHNLKRDELVITPFFTN